MMKKPVPALGAIGKLNFHSFPRAEIDSFSGSVLCFSFGLTQAIHIHATVPGSCSLGHAYVHEAGGAPTRTSLVLFCMPGEEEILPQLTGNDPDLQQIWPDPIPQRCTEPLCACEHPCDASRRGIHVCGYVGSSPERVCAGWKSLSHAAAFLTLSKAVEVLQVKQGSQDMTALM